MRIEDILNEDVHSGKKLYYFKGRNTPIVAKSVDEAKKKMKRGGEKLVKTRTPTESEMKQIRNGKWITTRVDGKSKAKSSYGKGRGYGPPRKAKYENKIEEDNMRIEDIFEKEQEQSKEVDDIIHALDGVTSVEVYDGGENFNVAFKDKDGVEHYIRPNDKGDEEFYIDSDDDKDEEVKVKDVSALKKKVKKMVG